MIRFPIPVQAGRLLRFGPVTAALACAAAAAGQTAPPAPDLPAPPAPAAPAVPDAAAPAAAAPVADAPVANPPPGAPRRQPRPARDNGGDPDAEIVVNGQRPRGSVIGDIPPEIQLGPAEIRSYGVSSIADLLNELAPQTTSGRGTGGAPVVLLNGRRISSFAEIQDIPTEAIARAEVLPEEVSLKYGYRADQKVVNIVLRQRFRAWTGEINDTATTAGGGNSATGIGSLLRIRNGSRLNLAAQYQHSDALLYADRGTIVTPSAIPYDVTGNITPTAGAAEIDPALSALAGHPVTIAGVPVAAADGAQPLGAFIPDTPNTTDLAPFRTLVPESEQFSFNAVYNRPLSSKVQATINARVQLNDSQAQLGLAGAGLDLPAGNPFSPFTTPVTVDRYVAALGPLPQDVKSTAVHGGLTVDGDFGADWRWNLTGNFDRSDSHTRTGRGLDPTALDAALAAGDPALNPFGSLPADLLTLRASDTAEAIATSGGGDLLVTGSPLLLPGGQLATSLRVGASTATLDSQSLRAGVASAASTTRSLVSSQFNVDVPITSVKNNVLAAIGDLTVNGNIEVNHLSDFGTLVTYGYGVHWVPKKAIDLLFSVTDGNDAPSQAQLGNPTVITPQVPVFDAATGRTVLVSRIDGGNPDLAAQHRHVMKLGLTLKPLPKRDLTITASYFSRQTRNIISAFPTGSATAAIEAAFPDRFIRDDAGNLTEFDSRPVNFAEEDRRDFRWGINFSKPIKSSLPDRFAALRAAGINPFAGFGGDRGGGGGAAGGPGGGGDRGPGGGSGDGARGGGERGPGGGGGGGGRGNFAGGSRIQFAVYHTWHLRDRVLIRDGLPALDLLNGGATGSSGGQPRHEVQVQAGISRDGLGARLSGNWQSATFVNGTAGTPATDLHFSSLATLNLRLFANLGTQPELLVHHPWLRGTRVTFEFNNMLDQRQRVTDGTGVTPLSYQPGLVDPLGRTVKLSLRKVFF